MSKKPRQLPTWMKGSRRTVQDAISNIVSTTKPAKLRKLESNENSSENRSQNFEFNEALEPSTKRRLRSNFQFPKTEQELRATEPNFNTDDFPMLSYDGKIQYFTDFFEMAEILDILIKKVEAKAGDELIGVAFDMEWTFNWTSGPEKTSLIQVCLDLDECFLFHLPQIKKLPASLSVFLGHPRVKLTGVNIKNDLRKLARDYPTVKVERMIANCVDLGVWYNEVFNCSGRWSMERLVLQVLKKRIDKSRQVRMSKWHVLPLSLNQRKYAAFDVFVAQEIYHHILQAEKENAGSIQGFFSQLDHTGETLPAAEEINNEIGKLMQKYHV